MTNLSKTVLGGSPIDPPVQRLSLASLTGCVLTFGLGTSVAMWAGWLVMHGLPEAVRPIPAVQGYVLLAFEFFGAFLAGAALRRRAANVSAGSRMFATSLAGGMTAIVNLMALSAKLADDAGAQHGAELAQAVGLFVGQGVIVGAIAGMLASIVAPAATDPRWNEPRRWLARLAGVTTLSLAPLIVVGGLVTSFHAGMAVPDWPTTYGETMIFYPLSKMASNNQIFLEHSHRLLGMLAGFCTLSLWVFTLCVETRRWVKVWATGVFMLVCVQGLLGGLRVTNQSVWLAAVHGFNAQVLLSLTAALWVYTSWWYEDGLATPDARDARRRVLAGAAFHTFGLQLVLGVLYRHLGSSHVLFTHIGVAFLAVVLGFMAGAVIASRPQDGSGLARAQRRAGMAVAALVLAQFALGWGALAANPPAAKGQAPVENTDGVKGFTRTLHQANGAAVLGCSAALAAITRRAARRK